MGLESYPPPTHSSLPGLRNPDTCQGHLRLIRQWPTPVSLRHQAQHFTQSRLLGHRGRWTEQLQSRHGALVRGQRARLPNPLNRPWECFLARELFDVGSSPLLPPAHPFLRAAGAEAGVMQGHEQEGTGHQPRKMEQPLTQSLKERPRSFPPFLKEPDHADSLPEFM